MVAAVACSQHVLRGNRSEHTCFVPGAKVSMTSAMDGIISLVIGLSLVRRALSKS